MRANKILEFYLEYSIYLNTLLEKNKTKINLVFLAAIMFSNLDYADAQGFDGKKYGQLCNRILETLEGTFGAVLTAAAGIGALVASAAGGFRMAWSLLVVAIGSFTLRTYQEIWFEKCGG